MNGTLQGIPTEITAGTHTQTARKSAPTFCVSDIWRAPLHDFPIRDEILYQYASLSPEMEVLEVGPGSGFTAFRLARQIRRLTLLDISAEALTDLNKKLGERLNLDFVCADLSTPGLNKHIETKFHLAFGLDVFEYVKNPSVCLSNLASVLRPGGQLFLTYPNVAPPAGDGVTYFEWRAELDHLLTEAGFTSWEIFRVRLRPFAGAIYVALHERPLTLYRRLRNGKPATQPQIYDATWSFMQRNKLLRYKLPVHLLWVVLGAAMRVRGDIFMASAIGEQISRGQVVIRALK